MEAISASANKKVTQVEKKNLLPNPSHTTNEKIKKEQIIFVIASEISITLMFTVIQPHWQEIVLTDGEWLLSSETVLSMNLTEWVRTV